MVSRLFKGAAVAVATLSLASVASANCGTTFCGQSSHANTWSTPSSSFTTTMSSIQADATYGTGSISQTYSGGFSDSSATIAGLGHNEGLRARNCATTVHGGGEGRVIGCYDVVQQVPQTTYYRTIRPVINVRYPVPVPVPFTSPCHTFKIHSRYGDWHNRGQLRNSNFKNSCGGW